MATYKVWSWSVRFKIDGIPSVFSSYGYDSKAEACAAGEIISRSNIHILWVEVYGMMKPSKMGRWVTDTDVVYGNKTETADVERA